MRRLTGWVLAALLCAAFDATAQGYDDAGLPSMTCPGAQAWLAAHPETTFAAMQQRDAARTLTDPALAAELKARFERDQEARRLWIADRSNRQAQRAVAAIDADDIRWLTHLIATKGTPTAAQVGELGVHNTWLLAQHADQLPALQAALLPDFEQRHAEGELSASDLARFTDRVMVGQHRPQRYGTQFTPAQWASPHFGLPDDTAVHQVEDNQRALGTMTLVDYVCMMAYARTPH